MHMVFRILLLCTLLLLAGCSISTPKSITSYRGGVPPDRAIIIVGIEDEQFVEGQQSISEQFDHFSFERGLISGGCLWYERFRAEATASESEVRYFAFDAVPGHYVLSPFRSQIVDESVRAAFAAPAGEVTYIGNFVSLGAEPTVTRREDLRAASIFAESTGLPRPVLAALVPLDGLGPIFKCL